MMKSLVVSFVLAVAVAGCTTVNQMQTDSVNEKLGVKKSKYFVTTVGKEGFEKNLELQRKYAGQVIDDKEEETLFYQLVDAEKTLGCSFSGANRYAVRTALSTEQGVLLPAYVVDASGLYAPDWNLTAKIHTALTQKLHIKLRPLSDSRQYHSLVTQYLKQRAAERAKEHRTQSPLQQLGKMNDGSLFQTPFNVPAYYAAVLSKLPSAKYLVTLDTGYSSLIALENHWFMEQIFPGWKFEDAEAPPVSAVDAPEEVRRALGRASRDRRIARLAKNGPAVQFDLIERYKNFTASGLDLELANNGCTLSRHAALREGLEEEEKIRSEAGKQMAKTWMTLGWANLAERTTGAANKAELLKKANEEALAANSEMKTVLSKQQQAFELELLPFVSDAFVKLQVSGKIESKKLK